MREAIRFTLIVSLIVGLIIFTIVWPVWGFSIFGIVLFAIGLYDIFQKEHTILRNFPLLGHMRYMLELISPEIHQYFIENDTDGKPIDRNHRSYIYQRAKLQKETHPFGTQLNVEEENFKWMRHSIYPTKVQKEYPRVNIGGPDCEQTYSASLFNISAMSFGALSKNAIEALNKGAKEGNFFHDTGEGGISDYHRLGGDLVWEIGTGYFGCRTEEGNFDIKDEKAVTDFLAEKVEEIIVQAKNDFKSDALPLIRIRVDFTGGVRIHPARFGQLFVGKVANPKEILLFQKKSTRPTSKYIK